MQTTYRHHLHTGSGWTDVFLTLADDGTAMMEFDSAWMGSAVKRYRLSWAHLAISAYYGFLALRNLERYVSLESAITVEEDISALVTNDDLTNQDRPVPYRDVTFEYIRLPKSETWIADDPHLEHMRQFFSLARWNATFDLILWLHFSAALRTGELEGTRIGDVLMALDKMKFAVVAEAYGK